MSVLVVSVVYVRLAARLSLGKRSTYVRVLVIAAQFPTWMRVGQVAQAVVLLGLLIAAVQPSVRTHFARQHPRPGVSRGTDRMRSCPLVDRGGTDPRPDRQSSTTNPAGELLTLETP